MSLKRLVILLVAVKAWKTRVGTINEIDTEALIDGSEWVDLWNEGWRGPSRVVDVPVLHENRVERLWKTEMRE